VLLPREEPSPRRVLDEVERVLVDRSFAPNAARIGQELRSAGGLARAVDVIEQAAASTAHA
jgi:UDP:flavonoid glycosyltransferase YjiC (YdhE family)